MIPEPAEVSQPNVGPDPSGGLGLAFWMLVPVVGVLAGLGAGLLMLLLRLTEHLGWPAYHDNFLQAVRAAGAARRIGVLLIAGVLVFGLRSLLRRPTGGHAAELTESIWFHAGRMPVLPTLSRGIVSIIIVGLGASLGREAAPKQIGALVGSRLGLRLRLPPGQRRLLVAFGAGAGMAAVYNVPFGGALFALEVLLGTLALPLLAPALATSLIATAAAWLILPDRATYSMPSYTTTPGLMAWALLAGPLAGLLSVGYVRLIAVADAHRFATGSMRLLAPLGVFLALGLLSLGLPEVLGNGKDVVQLALDGQASFAVLALVTLLKPLCTAACLGSGAPGGLFTPTLTLGAAFGALTGALWSSLVPGAPSAAYALIGATAVLAASSQGPVSAILLVTELTGRLNAMVPIMLAVAAAVLLARRLESRSIYSGRIHAGRERAQQRPGAVPRISSAARYAELMHRLLELGDTCRSLEVIDEQGQVIGQIEAERVRHPEPWQRPLETATARDFIDESSRNPERREPR